MSNTVLTPAVLEAIDTFKKADARLAGAITTRANAQRLQATVAASIGAAVAEAVAAESLDFVEEATGLKRAKVDRIARMGRITRGLAKDAIKVDDDEIMADLTKVWLKVSSSKGVPVAVIDRLGAKPFGTVAGLKEAVDAATVAAPTLAGALKALEKAVSALEDLDVTGADDEQADALEDLLERMTRVVATVSDDEEAVA